MKYVVSVSKKRDSIWKIYYYEKDEDNNLVFKSKRISRLLIPFYKLVKCHRTKMWCDECGQIFLSITRLNNSHDECPYCSESTRIRLTDNIIVDENENEDSWKNIISSTLIGLIGMKFGQYTKN